jgi:hypothetical protein
MYRIDDATAATSIPAPEAAGTEGYFTEGNPATGTPATKVRGSWLNMIQEELCAILAAAGITRSKTTYNQVNQALQKLYSPVIGSARNVSMSVTAVSATATLTADEIVVGAALGGQKYMLSGFSKTINLATTGAGGMDAGTAPASSFVALYAIYNPTTGTSALLAQNASTLKPNVYGGANMPGGYTASALVAVWPTTGGGQFTVGELYDRQFDFNAALAISTSTAVSVATPASIATIVPPNAKTIDGTFLNSFNITTGTQIVASVYSTSTGVGQQTLGVGQGGSGVLNQVYGNFRRLRIAVQQTMYYSCGGAGGSGLAFSANINGYSI